MFEFQLISFIPWYFHADPKPWRSRRGGDHTYGSWISQLPMQSVTITTDVVSSNLGRSDRERCTTICDKVCKWFATGQWFSPVSSINKTDHYDTTEMLLKVVLNTFKKQKTNLDLISFYYYILYMLCSYDLFVGFFNL